MGEGAEVKLEDYITMLQRKLIVLGNVEVAMTQGGYYADGPLADLYDDPQLEDVKMWEWKTPERVETYLVLGHSYQSY
jgi:hypothetical protein